jgi:hypothetical protein
MVVDACWVQKRLDFGLRMVGAGLQSMISGQRLLLVCLAGAEAAVAVAVLVCCCNSGHIAGAVAVFYGLQETVQLRRRGYLHACGHDAACT